MSRFAVDLQKEPGSFLIRVSNRMSLTARILAVNILAVLVVIAGLLFLDSYRERLFTERGRAAQNAAVLLAAVSDMPSVPIRAVMLAEARANHSRVRIYGRTGDLLADSAAMGEPGFVLSPPDTELLQRAARQLDLLIDGLLLINRPAVFREPTQSGLTAWPRLAAMQPGNAASQPFYAPDVSPVFVGMARSKSGDFYVAVIRNPTEVRRLIRDQRFNILAAAGLALLVSVALSLFLARTLVRPLRELMLAAVKVRRGRAREVSVPRLPQRRDEIGLLARALSDMSLTLRDRIDATEAFAADVAHEIKNPLASLRSALESIRRIEDPGLRAELLAIAEDDVQRMDRMISDISDASRVDSELSRARFESIDMGTMIEQIVSARMARPSPEQAARHVKVTFARPRKGVAIVLGEDMRLARALDNLIDNAISFAPIGGLVEVNAEVIGEEVVIRVQDDGPGVPASARESIFRRFYSNRPNSEGIETPDRHSGLGLAIVQTIVQGHLGQIDVRDRNDGQAGALFEIRLPCADCDDSA